MIKRDVIGSCTYLNTDYTTWVNSVFQAFWLINLGVISKVVFNSEQPNRRKWLPVLFSKEEIISVLKAGYSACVVCTETIVIILLFTSSLVNSC